MAASETSGIRYYDYAAAARAEVKHLEPLAQRARESGIKCEVVVRPGLAADQILGFCESATSTASSWVPTRPVPSASFWLDPSPKPFCAPPTCLSLSLAPRSSTVPIATSPPAPSFAAVSFLESSYVVATFAAELAIQHNARLILQHVIRPQDRVEVLAGRSIEEIESDLLCLVPVELRERISVQTIVVPGDPTEELLYQSRAQQADLLVLGAHGASAFAAITRHGVVYKVLAHSHCPVITLSPAVLAESGVTYVREHQAESFLAGVF